MKIGFIGAGNMAKAIIVGLIDSGIASADIMASNRSQDKLVTLAQSTGIQCGTNEQVANWADLLVLGVKPQMMQTVLSPLSSHINARQPIVVTIAAGILVDSYIDWLDGYANIVRAMPNTPTLVKAGITGIYAHPSLTAADRDKATALFTSLGIVRPLESEAQIDDIIAIAGSSPAYFFMFLEAMQAEAESYGIDARDARALVAQAGLGAMKLAAASDENFATLKQNVMSKGGTTEQAIFSFEHDNLKGIVSNAMQACKTRAAEMAKS